MVRGFRLSPTVLGLGYLAGYVALDRLSFVYPLGASAITPWNPQTGLSFALILLCGPRYIPLLFAAPFLADMIVRGMPLSWPVEFALTAAVGGGYGLSLATLRRVRPDFDPTLCQRRDLLAFLVTAALGAGVVSCGYASVLVIGEQLDLAALGSAILRAWIGDVIGTVVLTPFLMVLGRSRNFTIRPWEQILAAVGTCLALWLILGFSQSWRFHLFYLLFLPVLWIALNRGLAGVTLTILITQGLLILAMRLSHVDAIDVMAFQFLMLILSVTGLTAGLLVEERLNVQTQLRLHHEALSRAARLASMGELAAALAHEINQPLTAIANYVTFVKTSLESGRQTPILLEAASKASAQVDRAADVIRRLRNITRFDTNRTAPSRLATIVEEIAEICAPLARKAGVKVVVDIPAKCPQVMADGLQIQQVLQNLLVNGFEAINGAGIADGVVTITAREDESGSRMEIVVADNGPGFSRAMLETRMLPFMTDKVNGTGLGLSLSRTIVENHGGTLWVRNNRTGASVHFTLPIAGSDT